MLKLASGVLFALGVSTFAAEPQAAKPTEPSVRVECHGKLRHGIVAMGGESTGTTITFDGTTWELKLFDEVGRTFAKEHHKQPITAAGSLRRVAGTAVPVRWIVDVERLAERDTSTHHEGVSLTVSGKLRRGDATVGEPPEKVIEATGVTWPLDLSSDATFPAKVELLTGKSVILMGRLERGSGAATSPRPIIRVDKLEAVRD